MRLRTAFAILFAISASVATAAQAGDSATLNVLGFSANGGVFAFEEYGQQDGSGFPYANRYYVNTTTDSFIGPSPVRVRIDDEAASIAQARAQAAAIGAAIVSDAELLANPGYLAGFNAITEISADPFRLAVNPRPIFPPIDPPLEFRLEQYTLPASGACAAFEVVAGFRLLSVDATPGGATTLLHEDSSVPSSRGCVTGYRLAGVQTFSPAFGVLTIAVLISVQRQGFEGPDHRWMAVTLKRGQP